MAARRRCPRKVFSEKLFARISVTQARQNTNPAFMKPFLVTASLLLIPSIARAQDGGIQFSQLLLTIAILLGIAASVYVFTLSNRMSGSAIGTALILFGAGMLGVVVSLLSVTWLKPVMSGYAGAAHDLFFIIGFVLMVLGSRKVAGLL